MSQESLIAFCRACVLKTILSSCINRIGMVEEVAVEELDQEVKLVEEECCVELAEIVLAVSKREFQLNAFSSTGLRKSPYGYPCPITVLGLRIVRSGTLPYLPAPCSSVYSHVFLNDFIRTVVIAIPILLQDTLLFFCFYESFFLLQHFIQLQNLRFKLPFLS